MLGTGHSNEQLKPDPNQVVPCIDKYSSCRTELVAKARQSAAKPWQIVGVAEEGARCLAETSLPLFTLRRNSLALLQPYTPLSWLKLAPRRAVDGVIRFACGRLHANHAVGLCTVTV